MRRSDKLIAAALAVAALVLAIAGLAAGAGTVPTQAAGPAGCIAQGSVKGCAVGRALAEPPGALAISPDGKNAYLVAADPERVEADALDVFDRDPTTGALTQKPAGEGCRSATGREGCTRDQQLLDSNNVAVSPDGRNVYVATGPGVVGYLRDAATGALTPLPVPGACLGGAAVRAPCSIDPGLQQASALAFSPDGRELYVGSVADPIVVTLRRDPATGFLRQPRGTAGCVAARGRHAKCSGLLPEGAVDGLLVSPDGRSVYGQVYNGLDGSIVIFERKPSGTLVRAKGKAGCLSQKGEGGCRAARGLHRIGGLALAPDGSQLYVSSAAQGYGGSIALFDRARAGALSQPAGKAACISANGGECREGAALASPFGIAVAADGTRVYAASLYGLSVLDRGPSGVLTTAPGTEACLSDFQHLCTHARNLEATSGVTFSPDGANLYVTSFEPGGVAIFTP